WCSLKKANATVAECVLDVFKDLTQLHVSDRISVREARERLAPIKKFVPKIGDGFKFPTVEELIEYYKKKHESMVMDIVSK
ncbi:hypothetical protein ADUPG1_010349, partial [Aduncisulcus paluster]